MSPVRVFSGFFGFFGFSAISGGTPKNPLKTPFPDPRNGVPPHKEIIEENPASDDASANEEEF
jgi:hypothetical protein